MKIVQNWFLKIAFLKKIDFILKLNTWKKKKKIENENVNMKDEKTALERENENLQKLQKENKIFRNKNDYIYI